MSAKVEQIITDRIIQALENGTVPWQKPWMGVDNQPRNGVNKKPYRGINIWMCLAGGFTNPNYLTLKQILSLSLRVKYDQFKKSTPIMFWTFFEVDDKDTGEKKRIPMARFYSVYNVEQLEEIPDKFVVKADRVNNNEIDALCEQVVENFNNGPKIEEVVCDKACYHPLSDTVTINPIDRFNSSNHFYATMFHELGHSTGHNSRLSRDKATYAFEELVAEITATMLCSECKIDTADLFDNSAAYIASWLKVLKDDRRLIIKASNMAQKSADCILGRQRNVNGEIVDEDENTKAA